MMAPDTLDARFDRIQRRAFILGLAALILAVLDGIRAPEPFFRSYLLAFVFWLGFPLGSAAVLILHHLTGGFWGLPTPPPPDPAPPPPPFLTPFPLPLLLSPL